MIQTVTAWADMVIKIWVEKMDQLGVSNSAANASSFAHFIFSNAGGDVARIEFAFAYFLKFTDMGVGKGVTVANWSNSNHNRIKKQWFNKTFLLEVRKLSNMLAANYAHTGALYVKEAFNKE